MTALGDGILTMTTRAMALASGLLMVGLSPAGAAATMSLAAHQATYALTLETVRERDAVSAAEGRIAVEFSGNACEGFSTTVRQAMRVADGEGRERVTDTVSATFEEGDGQRFVFRTVQRAAGMPDVVTEGAAERARDGGISVVLRGQQARSDLDAVAQFPTAHLVEVLRAAKEGQSLVTVPIFDGTGGGMKVYETTAIIGDAERAMRRPVDRPAAERGLAAMRRWPVTVSYFETGSGERTPLYTIAFDLFENGVSGTLRIDFGGFTMRGELTTLTLLPTAPCDKPR